MKTLRLLSTTAAVLLLGAGAVSAQGMRNDEAPGRTPSAQQNAPAEKVAPTLKSDQRKTPETTGQAAEPESDKKQLKTQKMDKDAPTAPAAKGSSDADGNANVKSKSTSESGAGAASSPNKSADEGKRSTTGQGEAGAGNLTSEQRTKITGIVRQHKVAPTQLNVSVRVGTRIPDSVHFYPLPQEVFVIYPEWRGYDYIMVGDEILVIDPRTHQIVAILEA
jgi:Protein of unknown function (DUF1236)